MPASQGRPYTSVGMDRDVLDRVDRLRVCTGRSRSHVIESALTHAGGLEGLERDHAEAIKKVRSYALGQGQTWKVFVREWAAQWAGFTRPPNIDALIEQQQAEAVPA